MFSFTKRVGDSLYETVQQGIRLRNLHRDGKEINKIITEDVQIPKPKRPVFSLNSDEGIAYYRLRDEHLKLNQQMFSAPLNTCIWWAVFCYQIFVSQISGVYHPVWNQMPQEKYQRSYLQPASNIFKVRIQTWICYPLWLESETYSWNPVNSGTRLWVSYLVTYNKYLWYLLPPQIQKVQIRHQILTLA